MRTQTVLIFLIILSIYGIVILFKFQFSYISTSYKTQEFSHFLIYGEKIILNATTTSNITSLKFYNKSNSEHQEYYCLRKKPHFSSEEYDKYWKYKTYQPCRTATKDFIKIDDNQIEAKCSGKNTPMYFFDPGNSGLFYKRGSLSVKWTPVKKNVENEFVLIKCSSKSIYTRVFFHYNQEVVDRAEKIRAAVDPNSKPFTLAILVFDSLSLMSAQKNLPQSLKTLEAYPYSYCFQYAKSFASTTRVNMIPALYGLNLTYQETLAGGSDLKDPKVIKKLKELQEKYSIWKYFSSLGYITYFGYDSAFDFLAKSIGTEILTDHNFINFYKLSNSVYKFTDMTENQRCAGDQGGHKPMLDHTLKYYKAYKGNLKFGYTHISSAHEDTGNIRTVDKDLADFLTDFFKLYSENKEDFVLFVMGDHGRMNNLLRFDNRGYLDVLNPMMYIATSKDLKDLNILKKNTERLIGRFDLHLTFKDLAKFPFGGTSDEEYDDLKSFYSVRDVVSLFREEIFDTRTCEDIGSTSQKCACDQFKPVDLNEYTYKTIVNEIIDFVNFIIYENSKNILECEKPELNSISSANIYEIRDFENGLESVYKLSYTLQYKITINAEVYFWYNKKDKLLNQFQKLIKKPSKIISINSREATLFLWDYTSTSPCNKSSCICTVQNSK